MIAIVLMFIVGIGLIVFSPSEPPTPIRVCLFISGILIIIFGICLIYVWLSWKNGTDIHRPKLTFKQFITIYDADPDKWDLECVPIGYTYGTGEKKGIDFASYFDNVLYDRFYVNKKKHDLQVQQLNVQAQFVKEAQLNLARKQADIDLTMKEKMGEVAREII